MLNLLAPSGLVAFCMAWAIGAQDVSNALGTSVGSKALSVNQAIVVGAVFEFLGSLMGGAVATTISRGVIAPESLESVELYVDIMFCTLVGAFCWLAFATYFSLPVSTTHSMIGSLMGLGLVHVPAEAVNTATLSKIVVSWVTSPVIGLVVSYSVFYLIYHGVLCARYPMYAALQRLPFFYGFTFGVLALFLSTNGPIAIRLCPYKAAGFAALVGFGSILVLRYRTAEEMTKLELRYGLGSASKKKEASDGVVTVQMGAVGVDKARTEDVAKPVTADEVADDVVVVVGSGREPRARVTEAAADGSPAQSIGKRDSKRGKKKSKKKRKAEKTDLSDVEQAEALFSPLMVVTACVVAFAHGSNDVSNSIGPFAAIVNIYMPQSSNADGSVPNWILMAGGVGIVVGLATYGYKVMATVGEKITKLTFTRGFAAQIATASTVLSATLIGLSVSTTHCLIGAVAGIALVESVDKLNMAMMKKIALSWIITMPASAFFSLLMFALLEVIDGRP